MTPVIAPPAAPAIEITQMPSLDDVVPCAHGRDDWAPEGTPPCGEEARWFTSCPACKRVSLLCDEHMRQLWEFVKRAPKHGIRCRACGTKFVPASQLTVTWRPL